MKLYKKCKKVYSLIKSNKLRETVISRINHRIQEAQDLKVIREYHLISEDNLIHQGKVHFREEPLISIVTPLYNTPKDFLEELICSVSKQTYKNWELCLVDGSDGTHTYVGELCKKYALEDKRIIYKKLKQNKGIVGNTNECMTLTSGAYIGLLDHDDLLHPSALYEVTKAINRGADFIYTDEMKFVDSIDNSTDIVCKNDYGKDELRSHNYICHFVVFKAGLLNEMDELYRQECEGSQDYDMVLRLTEKAKHIVHIPKILYYWRVHPASVSMNLSVKQYAVEAAKRAIAAQLGRCGEKSTVDCNYPYETIYKVNYSLQEKPLVSIFVWGEKKDALLSQYIREVISKTHYRPVEFIISRGVELLDVESIPVITVDIEANDRYDWFECAEKYSSGSYNLYLNDKCMPSNSMWIEEMLMYGKRKDVGVVGAHILYDDNKTYFAGAVLDKEESSGIHVINYNMAESEQGYEANLKHVRNTSILTSLCMLISKEQLHRQGGFCNIMGSCADADLCLRCKSRGLWNVWTCFAQMYYSGSESMYNYWNRNQHFIDKWKQELEEGDGYYHPLLKVLKRM